MLNFNVILKLSNLLINTIIYDIGFQFFVHQIHVLYNMYYKNNYSDSL
jgi:hypothetical protein